ncbi:MAG: hypothetical protein ACM3ZS_09505 [Nitrososphaerota archaeon]
MSVKRSSSAFGLSLAGGIIILFGTLVTLLFFANFHTSRMDGMMGGGMMGGGMMGGGWFFYLPLIAGILVILGAVLMKIIPKETTIWGIVVLVFSVIGFTGMGLSFIGAIIGIIGGVIAISKGSSG